MTTPDDAPSETTPDDPSKHPITHIGDQLYPGPGADASPDDANPGSRPTPLFVTIIDIVLSALLAGAVVCLIVAFFRGR